MWAVHPALSTLLYVQFPLPGLPFSLLLDGKWVSNIGSSLGRASCASCVSRGISATLHHGPLTLDSNGLPSCSVNSWGAGVIFLSSVPQTVAAQKRHLLNEWKYRVRGLCHRTKEGETTSFTTWNMPNFCPPQTLFYKKCWLHPDLNPHSHSDSWGLLWLAGEWLLAGRTVAAGDISGLCDLRDTLYSSWIHSSGKQSPLFKSEGKGKGINVNHALC